MAMSLYPREQLKLHRPCFSYADNSVAAQVNGTSFDSRRTSYCTRGGRASVYVSSSMLRLSTEAFRKARSEPVWPSGKALGW